MATEMEKREGAAWHRYFKRQWHGVLNLFGDHAKLTYERAQARLQGPAADVKRIKNLDSEIGSLMRPFNNASMVPMEVVNEIRQHIRDVELTGAFQRVSATRDLDSVEKIGAGLRSFLGVGTKDDEARKGPKVSWLEYKNRYKTYYGESSQNIASISLRSA